MCVLYWFYFHYSQLQCRYTEYAYVLYIHYLLWHIFVRRCNQFAAILTNKTYCSEFPYDFSHLKSLFIKHIKLSRQAVWKLTPVGVKHRHIITMLLYAYGVKLMKIPDGTELSVSLSVAMRFCYILPGTGWLFSLLLGIFSKLLNPVVCC